MFKKVEFTLTITQVIQMSDEGLPIRLGSIKTWTLSFGIFDIFAMGKVYVSAVLLNTAIYHPFNEKSESSPKLGIINV
jgi:hypothetical protein